VGLPRIVRPDCFRPLQLLERLAPRFISLALGGSDLTQHLFDLGAGEAGSCGLLPGLSRYWGPGS
jgi:hypothetical protein